MMERSIVVVSRPYKQLQIHHRVVHARDEIRIEMDLAEFLENLSLKMGATVCLNAKQLLGKMAEHVDDVIQEMKESTKYSPPPNGG